MKANRKALLIAIASVFFCAAVVAAAPVRRIHEIQRPLLSVPAIVEQGGTFKIELKPEGKEATEAKLKGSFDESLSVGLHLGVPVSADGLTEIQTTVPLDAPEALYDLTVAFSDGSSDTQPHAVKVVREVKKDFDFVHLTDIHFNCHQEGEPDVNPVRAQVLKDISKQNPEFVLFSGDLGLDPATYDADYAYGYEQFLKLLTVPMYMVPGNHELYIDNRPDAPIDGLDYWAVAYGPTYHSFDYGNLHVAGINNFDWEPRWRDRWDEESTFFATVMNAQMGSGQWEWLKEDLRRASAAGRDIIAFAHIPVNMMQGGRRVGLKKPEKLKGPTPEMFKELLNSHGVTHIFVGHLHFNQVRQFGNLTHVMTVTGGSGDLREKWGYRVVHVRGGKVAGWDVREVGFDDVEKDM